MMRCAVKSALMLVADAARPETGLEAAWDYVATGTRPDGISFNWTPDPCPWLPANSLGPVPHIVTIEASSQTNSVAAHVHYFGHFGVCGTIARNIETGDWQAAYAVDPWSGAEESCSQLDRPLGKPVTEETVACFYDRQERAMGRLGHIVDRRARELLVQRTVRDAFQRHVYSSAVDGRIPAEAVTRAIESIELELALALGRSSE